MSVPDDHLVDLHTHSSYSDGLLSPAALVAEAAARGVRFLGLTDHDTVAGIPEAQEAGAELGVEVIPGVELSTSLTGGEDVHLLGYFIDVTNPVLLAGLAGFAAARQDRAARILARLREIGIALDEEQVYALAGHGTIGRPHIARALVAAGHATDLPDAFSRLIGRNKPAYVPRPRVDPRDAIGLVKAAGGVPVLAHPFSPGGIEGVLDRLVPVGLQGMEVDYGEYTPDDRTTLRQIAGRRGLIATGGSDFHGPGVGSPSRVLGGPPVPLAAVDNLRAAAPSQNPMQDKDQLPQ